MSGDDARSDGDDEPHADDRAAVEPPEDEPPADGEAAGVEPPADEPQADGEADGVESQDDDADGGFGVSRRQAVVGGLGVLVGGVVGVGATLATGGNQIRKKQPNNDGKGTLGELRWILEEEHGLRVSSMVRNDETVEVTYRSNAESRGESREEIGMVISSYGLILAADGPTEELAATIEDRFEDQAMSYRVQAEWVKEWRAGEMSDSVVAQRVFNTRRFPEGADAP
jgi:hypothetical protein